MKFLPSLAHLELMNRAFGSADALSAIGRAKRICSHLNEQTLLGGSDGCIR
jgi:hypothetical protein